MKFGVLEMVLQKSVFRKKNVLYKCIMFKTFERIISDSLYVEHTHTHTSSYVLHRVLITNENPNFYVCLTINSSYNFIISIIYHRRWVHSNLWIK